jgi:predicted alpha/beta-fold hydrolase
MELMFKLLKSLMIFLLGYYYKYVDFKSIIFLYLLYCLYNYIACKTEFIFHKDARKDLIQHIRDLKFKPHFLLPNSFLQLFLFPYIDKPLIEYEHEDENKHGVCLKWTKLNYEINKDEPILFLIPGVAGREDASYIINTIAIAVKHKYRTVVYINRLVSTQINIPDNEYIDLFEDFNASLLLIKKKYPKSKIYAVGFSYGANILVNYMGTNNLESKLISGAVSVCNPFDLLICQRAIKGTIYEKLILHFLKKVLNQSKAKIPEKHDFHNYDLQKAINAKNLWEYDENLISKIMGYKCADSYYRGISCHQNIDKVDVPLLCISSIDDNITSTLSIPYPEIASNKNIYLITTTHGGHISYISNDSLFTFKQWIYTPIMNFINTLDNKI